jgi:hypothetical protein
MQADPTAEELAAWLRAKQSSNLKLAATVVVSPEFYRCEADYFEAAAALITRLAEQDGEVRRLREALADLRGLYGCDPREIGGVERLVLKRIDNLLAPSPTDQPVSAG